MEHVIYALLCPYTRRVRYVGYTKRGIEQRLAGHVRRARSSSGRRAPRLCWIKKLLAAGTVPIIEVLERVSAENWQERERYWIGEFGGVTKLLNCTTGGDAGTELSEATIKKLRRKFSPEHRARISAAGVGRKLSAESRAKMSAAAKRRGMSSELVAARFRPRPPRTPEHCANLSASLKGWRQRQ